MYIFNPVHYELCISSLNQIIIINQIINLRDR